MTNKCVSCNKEVDNFVKFKCPECGSDIIRCQHCRALDIDYKCSKCGFIGP